MEIRSVLICGSYCNAFQYFHCCIATCCIGQCNLIKSLKNLYLGALGMESPGAVAPKKQHRHSTYTPFPFLPPACLFSVLKMKFETLSCMSNILPSSHAQRVFCFLGVCLNKTRFFQNEESFSKTWFMFCTCILAVSTSPWYKPTIAVI